MSMFEEVESEIRKRATENALRELNSIERRAEIEVGYGVIRPVFPESQKQLFVSQAVEESLSRIREHLLLVAVGKCGHI